MNIRLTALGPSDIEEPLQSVQHGRRRPYLAAEPACSAPDSSGSLAGLHQC